MKDEDDLFKWQKVIQELYHTNNDYITNKFQDIKNKLIELNDSKEQLLIIMDIAKLFKGIEYLARENNKKYEKIMAMTLKCICHIEYEFTSEQIKSIINCVNNFMDKWGYMNGDDLRTMRKELLQVGLTWLPITDRAREKIEKNSIDN